MLFWKGASPDRLNKRVMGMLKGVAHKKAKMVIDRDDPLNMSGIYGSIEIDESDSDFISDSREKKRTEL